MISGFWRLDVQDRGVGRARVPQKDTDEGPSLPPVAPRGPVLGASRLSRVPPVSALPLQGLLPAADASLVSRGLAVPGIHLRRLCF